MPAVVSPAAPSGAAWLHLIKHDGFRVIARKDGERVRLYSRPGNDLTGRFPLIVEALARLRARSCIVDGEAVCCGDDGIASFDRMRDWRYGDSIFLYAFDLIELNGDDFRRDPLTVRKATLTSLVARAAPGLRLNEHLDHDDGPLVFEHTCRLGLEGIVSKRRDSPYSSGRSPYWIKSKNLDAPAVKREAEDWSRWSSDFVAAAARYGRKNRFGPRVCSATSYQLTETAGYPLTDPASFAILLWSWAERTNAAP